MNGSAVFLALVVALGSPSFKVREAAQKALAAHLDAARPALMAGERSPDPEVRQRSKLLSGAWYARHAPRVAEAFKPANWPDFPWYAIETDVLPRPDNEFPKYSAVPLTPLFALAVKLVPCKEPEWRSWSAMTRAVVVHLITLRREDEARRLVGWLAEYQRGYCRRRGLPVPP